MGLRCQGCRLRADEYSHIAGLRLCEGCVEAIERHYERWCLANGVRPALTLSRRRDRLSPQLRRAVGPGEAA